MRRLDGMVRTLSVLALAGAGMAGLVSLQPALAQAPERHVVYLDQAWSSADRAAYYWGSQGSALLSYDIFVALEIAGSRDLFNTAAKDRKSVV